jgi:hypothetical protein
MQKQITSLTKADKQCADGSTCMTHEMKTPLRRINIILDLFLELASFVNKYADFRNKLFL